MNPSEDALATTAVRQDVASNSPDLAQAFWADMREQRAKGKLVCVEEYLMRPELPKDRTELILDLIYAEYALREMAGEAPTITEYVQRFPTLADSIKRQLDFHNTFTTAIAHLSESARTHADVAPKERLAAEIPHAIGKYRVVQRLGSGGQGTVYRAIHPTLGQDVVLKVAHRTSPMGGLDQHRIATEGRILSELRHGNIARVYDLDLLQGQPVLVMEYIPGRNLEQAALERRFSSREVANVVTTIARAVAYAHARGVAHLDIKPANILVSENGVLRLIDFGLGYWQSAWDMATPGATFAGGTLAYCAPEMADQTSSASPERVDVFGLGALLYFLLTGSAPFSGKSAVEVWEKARSGRWGSEFLDNSQCPYALKAICKRCLAKDPRDRYESMNAVAEDLDRFTRRLPISRRQALIASALGIGSVGLAAFVRQFITDRVNGDLPQLPPIPADPVVRIRVWQGNRYQELVNCLPLQSGDELRIETEHPAQCYAVLLWADTEGSVHELCSVRPDESRSAIEYPHDRSKSTPLQGRPGTEFIVLCARRDRAIDVTRFRESLRTVREWPPLPSSLVLRLGRGGVTSENSGRGPAPVKVRFDPEREVSEQLRKLQTKLSEECEIVVGVAVAHE